MNIVLLGSTGATGSSILKHLDQLTTIGKITTISRNPPKTQSDKINSIVASVENWYKSENYTSNDTAISAFGTTKANAGGIEKFEEIDRGYNYKFAQAAKENGVKNFILISSMGASSSSSFPYLRIKGDLEQDIIKLGFDKTVILRPGFLITKRENHKTSLASISASIIQTLNPIIGPLAKGVETSKLGQLTASIAENIDQEPKVSFYEGGEIRSKCSHL